MALAKLFSIFELEDYPNDVDGPYIWLHDFSDYFKKNYKSPPDKKKDMHPCNILKTLNTYDSKIKTIEYSVVWIKLTKKAIPVLSIAKYIFQNADSLKSCKMLAQAIIQQDVKCGICHKSLLECYVKIAESSWLHP